MGKPSSKFDGDTTRDDETPAGERERAVEALTEALETDELDEKDYRIREALQLLTLADE
ncbi:hypothetical protein M0R89_01870 [Halorussus limi]|uniref:Uncharacterized protein n=1 Tax=Halorussus limi TaxID=2938695 RepID=A0A8U0HUX1_9EURY|nr:hypothetical protein [Halorussus limi]UPV74830.1 hypothetical protein M0R89_01870 [Halorussus limi]